MVKFTTDKKHQIVFGPLTNVILNNKHYKDHICISSQFKAKFKCCKKYKNCYTYQTFQPHSFFFQAVSA